MRMSLANAIGRCRGKRKRLTEDYFLVSRSSKRLKGNKIRRVDDFVVPEIPLDLLIEILARLPAKSLMRFKCVSNIWFSLIRSRHLTNRYLQVASPHRTPRLYMSLVDHVLCNNSIDVCYNPYESVLLSTSSSNSRSFDQRLTIPGTGGHNMVIFRGLILYNVCRKACIYNPATRQNVSLPAVQSHIFSQKAFQKNVIYFVGHDPALDQYKILCTVVISSKRCKRITSEHWVWVLEAGGFWRRIKFDHHHFPTILGPCIDGVVYYLAATPGISQDVVASFDVRSEELSMIQAPPEVVSSLNEDVGLIEYAGRPTIIDYTHLRENGLLDLWVLGDTGKWSKKSLVLKPCQMHLLHDDIHLEVEGTTRNGVVIFIPLQLLSPFYIFYYDLERNDLRKVKIRGIPDHWLFGKPNTNLKFYLALMDRNQSIMHLEL